MPPQESDMIPNGRASQASNMSAVSRASRGSRGPAVGSDAELAVAPGVQRMLRTSTDMGNLDGLIALDSFAMAAMARASRRGATSRMSSVSSVSIHSNRTSMHRPHTSQASQHPRHRSRESNVPHYVADTLSPTQMNFTGPSPYFPSGMRPRDQCDTRDGYRTSSMITQHTAESMQLSANRSFSSLRASQLIQRPADAYQVPRRNSRFNQRPSSPAYSDSYAGHSGRGHGLGGQHMPGRERLRTRSNMSLRSGPAIRAQSPIIFGEPHADIPPVPPLVSRQHRGDPYPGDQYQGVDQAVPSHRRRMWATRPSGPPSASASSCSTSRRGDSDPPSSDPTAPPTPTYVNAIGGPDNLTFEQVSHRNRPRPMRKEVMSCPEYYDGSEAFADGQIVVKPDVIRSANGFFRPMKDIIEEKTSPEPAAKKNDKLTVGAVIAELPASPVPPRLTKDLVRSKIPFPSPTVGGEFHEASVGTKSYRSAPNNGELATIKDQRRSTLSQADFSILDSPTVDLARSVYTRYADGGLTTTSVNSGELPEADATTTTEDGMSDLLEGYRHTDMKQEIGSVTPTNEGPHNHHEKNFHTPKSSDIQSFKSCTDPADIQESFVNGSDEICLKPLEDSNAARPSGLVHEKEIEARAFNSFHDGIASTRAEWISDPKKVVSMPAALECLLENSSSTTPSLAPSLAKQQTPSPFFESGVVERTQPSSNTTHDIKQDSVVTFASSSKRSVTQPPLPVPRRESSSSKEAPRAMSVGALLSKYGKLTKHTFVKSSKKEAKQSDHELSQKIQAPLSKEQVKWSGVDASQTIPTPPPMRPRPASRMATGSLEPSAQEIKPVLTDALSKDEESSQEGTTPRECTPSEYPDLRVTPIMRIRRTPSGQSVSVSSPRTSSFFPVRIQTNPGFIGMTQMGTSDSPSTTHLSWPGPKCSIIDAVKTNNGCVLSDQTRKEPTKIDQRPRTLSECRRNYRPDLKEKSHEDLSLNTSASNLKHLSFRFPSIVQADLCGGHASLDASGLFARASTAKSVRNSIPAKDRCLPPMEFSEINLLEKLDGIVEHRGSRSLDLSPKLREVFAQSEPHRAASVEFTRDSHLPTVSGRAFAYKNSSLPVVTATKKRITPQELKQSVDNVNIPTMDGLTQRVSELIPSIKQDLLEKDSIAEQKMVEAVREDLKELGDIGATKGRSWSVAHTGARDETTLADFAAPSPALRTRSLSLGHRKLHISSDSRHSSKSACSLDSTPTDTVTDTRPWNRDENYPWATTGSVEIDISLPPTAAVKSSPRPGPSNLRNRLSTASSTSGTFSPEGMPGSPTSPVGASPALGTGNRSHSRRESQRRWTRFVSSNKQPIGLPSGIDASGFATAPVRVRDDDQSHGTGDRYPTKLPLPSYLQIADSTSRLSDYTTDEDLEPLSSRRSRLIRRTRRSRRLESGRPRSSRAQEVPQTVENEESTSFEACTTGVRPRQNRRTFSGAEGMSRWTYLSSKVVYKVKSLYHRVRCLGRRVRKNNDGQNNRGEQVGILVMRPCEAEHYVGHVRIVYAPNTDQPLHPAMTELINILPSIIHEPQGTIRELLAGFRDRFYDWVEHIRIPQVRRARTRKPIE